MSYLCNLQTITNSERAWEEAGDYYCGNGGTSRPATAAEILLAKKMTVIEQINTEASRRILSAYPLEKQSSANLGIYPQTYTDKMIADIAAVIQASNDACDLVTAAVDIAGVEAVMVNWPVIGA